MALDGFLLQVDDGSTEGANAYVDADTFTAYHTLRGNSFLVAGEIPEDDFIRQAIVRATAYIDVRFKFKGSRIFYAQGTAWPRSSVMDGDGFIVTGIPSEVKDACCELALIALTNPLEENQIPETSPALIRSKREKVGPIEQSVVYQPGIRQSRPYYQMAQDLLRDLLAGTSNEIVRA